jgi:hypothetical protein
MAGTQDDTGVGAWSLCHNGYMIFPPLLDDPCPVFDTSDLETMFTDHYYMDQLQTSDLITGFEELTNPTMSIESGPTPSSSRASTFASSSSDSDAHYLSPSSNSQSPTPLFFFQDPLTFISPLDQPVSFFEPQVGLPYLESFSGTALYQTTVMPPSAEEQPPQEQQYQQQHQQQHHEQPTNQRSPTKPSSYVTLT